jgi:hypothetical protein
LKTPVYVSMVIWTLNVCLELLQSHRKAKSHDDYSVLNSLTSPTGFRRYIHVSWNSNWLKVRVYSLSLSCLHRNGKLVKSENGKTDNMSTISVKVCSHSLNSCKF